jgi:hypothetical protein
MPTFASEFGVVSSVAFKYNPTFKYLTVTFIVEKIFDPPQFLDELISHVRKFGTPQSKIGFGIKQTTSHLDPFYVEFRPSLSGAFILDRLALRLQSEKTFISDSQLMVTFTLNKATPPSAEEST